MIKQEQITLTLERKTIKSLYRIAAARGLSREELIAEWVRDYDRRERVRSEIKRVGERKRKAPIVAERAKRYLAEPRRVSEKQLGNDIEAAIAAVRGSSRRTH